MALTEMLASTENIGVVKMLASTKYSCRQNSCTDRNLTSTKISHQQNVGVCAKASPYCLARQSPQQLTSPKPHINDLLYLLEGVEPSICSRQVCRCHWSPCFYQRTLSRTVPACYTGPPSRKRHKYWRRQNIGARQDFTDFCQTIAVNISAHKYPIKNF